MKDQLSSFVEKVHDGIKINYLKISERKYEKNWTEEKCRKCTSRHNQERPDLVQLILLISDHLIFYFTLIIWIVKDSLVKGNVCGFIFQLSFTLKDCF